MRRGPARGCGAGAAGWGRGAGEVPREGAAAGGMGQVRLEPQLGRRLMEQGWRDGRQEAGPGGCVVGRCGEGLRRARTGSPHSPPRAPGSSAGRRPGRPWVSSRLPQECGLLALGPAGPALVRACLRRAGQLGNGPWDSAVERGSQV